MLPTHDFCFTLPWGLFIALGGLSGFLIAGSAKSLAFGGGFGALLMLLGVSSLRRWKRGLPSRFETAASLVITLALTVVMGKKWLAGASVVPSGVIAIAALFMDVFYFVNIVSGGNPPPANGVEGGGGGGEKGRLTKGGGGEAKRRRRRLDPSERGLSLGVGGVAEARRVGGFPKRPTRDGSWRMGRTVARRRRRRGVFV